MIDNDKQNASSQTDKVWTSYNNTSIRDIRLSNHDSQVRETTALLETTCWKYPNYQPFND